MYDLIVIGASIAGLSAAREAAEAGASVLVVEKKKEVGTPLKCAGFLPAKKELTPLLPSALCDELLEKLFDYPERVVLNQIHTQRIISPSGYRKEFLVEGDVLDRRAFDQYLAKLALQNGCELWLDTRFVELTPTGVIVSKGGERIEVGGSLILGADGALSKVATSAGIEQPSKSNCSVCSLEVVECVDVDSEVLEMYFGNRFAPGGYGWIVPLGEDRANIGVGVRLSTTMKPKLGLKRFKYESPASSLLSNAQAIATGGGFVPVAPPIEPVCTDRVMLAGDAASLVLSTNGGGIPLAAMSGMIAGRHVIPVLNNEYSLQQYQRVLKATLYRAVERTYLIRRVADGLMGSDKLMNSTIRLLRPSQLKAIQQGTISSLTLKTLSIAGWDNKF
ncbi:MAG: geranylgeranyl reductase family protein [Methermicoccaceae archaeon]